jgi:hypothetical protein
LPLTGRPTGPRASLSPGGPSPQPRPRLPRCLDLPHRRRGTSRSRPGRWQAGRGTTRMRELPSTPRAHRRRWAGQANPPRALPAARQSSPKLIAPNGSARIPSGMPRRAIRTDRAPGILEPFSPGGGNTVDGGRLRPGGGTNN